MQNTNVSLDNIIEFVNDPEIYGRMNDPSGASFLKGQCGDEMEFYLVIENNQILQAKYYSKGCDATKVCGAMAAHMVLGKTLDQALFISAGEIVVKFKNFPKDHLHCSILAVNTLYGAITDYLLKL